MTEPDDDLREKAREHVEQMPAETALGNPDPAGGEQDVAEILDDAARAAERAILDALTWSGDPVEAPPLVHAAIGV